MDQPEPFQFGHKLRLRVCGLHFLTNGLLLINHKGLYGHDFWSPPGGGVEFGEPLEVALKRELLEECCTLIEIKGFLFGTEFIKAPLHAVELFYEISLLGNPSLGTDPELGGKQLITELKAFNWDEIAALPPHHRHGMFNLVTNPAQIRQLVGIYPIT